MKFADFPAGSAAGQISFMAKGGGIKGGELIRNSCYPHWESSKMKTKLNDSLQEVLQKANPP